MHCREGELVRDNSDGTFQVRFSHHEEITVTKDQIEAKTFPKRDERILSVLSDVLLSADGFAFKLKVDFTIKQGAAPGAIPGKIGAWIFLQPDKCLPEVKWPCTHTFQIRLLASDINLKKDIVRNIDFPDDPELNGPKAVNGRGFNNLFVDAGTVYADYVAQDTAVFSVVVSGSAAAKKAESESESETDL